MKNMVHTTSQVYVLPSKSWLEKLFYHEYPEWQDSNGSCKAPYSKYKEHTRVNNAVCID